MVSSFDRKCRCIKFSLAICLVVLHLGCAAPLRIEESLESWIGKTGDELLAAYDTAPSVYTLDEHTTIFTWSASKFRPVDPLKEKSKIWSPEVLTSSTKRCAVSFTVVDGIVRKLDVRGESPRLCPTPREPSP